MTSKVNRLKLESAIEKLAGLVGVNRKVLLVGCSTHIKRLLEHASNEVYCVRMDVNGTISDLSTDGTLGDAPLACRNLGEVRYDVIVFHDVLAMLLDPASVLADMKKYLAPKGFIVMNVHNICHGDVVLNLVNQRFDYTRTGLVGLQDIRFFSIKNIVRILGESGYSITELETEDREIGCTERGNSIHSIPGPLLEYVKDMPFAQAYQFILKALPSGGVEDNYSLPEIELPGLDLPDLKDIRASQLNESNELKNEIQAIKSSISWKAVSGSKELAQRFFSVTTGRRNELSVKTGLSSELKRKGLICGKAGSIPPIDYAGWIRLNEHVQKGRGISGNGKELKNKPLISVILPVFPGCGESIDKTIDSVLGQSYDNWELHLTGTANFLGKIAGRYKGDPRIRIIRQGNSSACLGGIDLSTLKLEGELAGFLRSNDELAPCALQDIVELLDKNPQLDIIYSDEDLMDKGGRRYCPFFKPDWSPDLFRSFNYMGFLTVLRRSLIEKNIGSLESNYEKSLYDLLLKTTETIGVEKIGHIKKILYHRRGPGVDARCDTSPSKKDLEGGISALEDMVKRRALDAHVVKGMAPGTYRVKYDIKGSPKVSIIIPTKDHVDVLRTCIESIKKRTEYGNYDILVVDNNSMEEETFDYYDNIKSDPEVRILHYDKPFNFSEINNYAVSQTKSRYLLFLNNDTEVISRGWLGALLEHAQRKEVGAVGAKLIFPNGSIQHCGVILGSGTEKVASHLYGGHPDQNGYYGAIDVVRNCSAVTGACMMIRRSVFEEAGGLDPNLKNGFNDIDLCLKLRARGYFVVYTPYAKLYHHESLSRGYAKTREDMERVSVETRYMRSSWGELIDRGDPFYNSNLKLYPAEYSLPKP